MKKPIVIISVIVAVVAAFFVVRSFQSKDSGEAPFVIAFENDVVTLEPMRIADVYSIRVASQMFEGLARLNEKNEIVPSVAESWSHTPDFTRWTFKLRPGVKFHPHPSLNESARILTSADVVYSFTRMLAKDSIPSGPLASVIQGASEYQNGEAKDVSGIRAVSDNEVEFILKRPDAQFLGRAASPSYGLYKQAVVEAAGTAFGQSVAIGTGPYRFVERKGNDLILERYEDYWGDNQGPKKVIFRTIKEDTVRLAEAKAGRLDATYATAPMLNGLVERDGDAIKIKQAFANSLTAVSFPTYNTTFLAFNWPNIDPDLRRAIASAVDREQIAKAVVPMSGKADPDPIPYASTGYVSKIKATRDVTAAKVALEAYRAKNPGVQPKIRILVHELAQAVLIGEVLQSQLKEVGIEVEIVQQSFNATIGLIQKKDFDAVVLWFEYMYAMPQLMLETYYTSGAIPIPNVFLYSEPRNDSSIAALFSIGDAKAALDQTAEAAKNLVADNPGVFLYQTQQVILVRPGIEGLRFNSSNLPFLSQVVVKK